MKNVSIRVGAITIALLMASAAFGAERPIGDYDPSSNGFYPEVGNLKNQNACPDGTAFFKNVAPGLTNGSGGSPVPTTIDFAIDGEIVTMSISWDADNSFGFNLTGGVAHIVGVTSDTNNLLYDYVDFYPPPSTDPPVFSDENLNSIVDAADVNHLDLCLAVVDTTPPSIIFISPLQGDTVLSGTVTVHVEVTDDSGLGPVTASVYQDDVLIEDLGNGQLQSDGTYKWEWNTVDPLAVPPVDLPPGSYTIAVTAEDLATPFVNTQTVDVTVDLINSLVNCFGILGPEDFTGEILPDGYANGCEATPLANVQAPPYTKNCNPDLVQDPNNIPDYCTIWGEQLKPDPAVYGSCHACVEGYCGEYGLPDPRMICDGIWDSGTGACDGNYVPSPPLRPLNVADVAEPTADGSETELVLGKYVYGYKGCFAASQHFKGGNLSQLYPEWPEDDPDTPEDEATGLVFIKTHRPDNVILDDDLVAECFYIGSVDVAQAGYQPVLKTQSVDTLADGTTAAITLAATQECFNPPRTLTRDNGIDVSNIIETDGSVDPDDEVAFKYQMAQMQFDALYAALDCAQPTFQRGRIKFSDVSSPINQAQAQFSNGSIAALERARDDLEDAALAIRTAKWDVTAENCAGDALARTENLAWRMTDLIAAPGP